MQIVQKDNINYHGISFILKRGKFSSKMALQILSEVINTFPKLLETKDNFTNQNGGKNEK